MKYFFSILLSVLFLSFLGIIPASAMLLDGDIVVVDANGAAGNDGLLFRIDPVTGARSVIHDFDSGELDGINPVSLVILDSDNILVLDQDGGINNAGQLFRIQLSTNTRVRVNNFGSGANPGVNPTDFVLESPTSALVIDRDGGTDNRGQLLRVSLVTGARTVVSDFGFNLQGLLGMSPSGIFLENPNSALVIDLASGSSDRGALYRVNLNTGFRTQLSNFGAGPNPGLNPIDIWLENPNSALVVDRNIANIGVNGVLFRVNLLDGERSIISNIGSDPGGIILENPTTALVVDESGGTDNRGQLFRVDTTNGTVSLLHNFGSVQPGEPLGVDPNGVAVYFAPVVAMCGDGNVEGEEECDLGDGVNGTAGACCSASCEFETSDTQCRASAGVCDIAETCTGSSDTCPVDGFAGVDTICRAADGICDVQELCDGFTALCPVDNVADTNTQCRDGQGICDFIEFCDGSNKECPADMKSTGICRPSAGVCDVDDFCDGVNNDCPTDLKQPSNYECRASVDVCDVAETCDGVGNDCPANALEPSGTVCRASAGSCDIAEECTGDASACPADAFEPDTTECRASAGVCDLAESCTGTGAACPADGFEPDTTSCRAAVNSCDIEEFCSGSGVECPVDELMDEGSICTADNGGPDGQCLRDPLICVNQGLITIIKEADTTDDEDGQDFEFSCTDSTTAACADMGDENGMFFLDDPVIDDLDLITDSETSDPMFIGVYSIEEMVPTGWQLDMIECVDDEDGETIADADAANVLINLDPDEEVICTFFNSDIPVTIAGFNNTNRLRAIKNRDNRIRITGITPEGLVRIFWGFRKGTDFVEGGNCAGTEINIRNMSRLADVRANESGNLNRLIFIPGTPQNKAFMVPLDLSNCMAGSREQITLLND